MPIEATRFHNAAKNHARHTDSNYLQQLSVAQWDYYFNRARDLVIENLVAQVEINSTISEHLRPLTKRKVALNLKKVDENCDVAAFPSDYFALLRQGVTATNECCDGQKRTIIVRMVSSDKIDEARRSTNWKPSWDFEETVGYLSDEGLVVFHDGEFKIEEADVDYIRRPSDIRAPSLANTERYIDETGKVISEDSDFDVDSTYLWRKIVDVAVLLALRDDNKVQNFQTQLQSILFGEKAYIYPVERT